ncbi:hypothetical protein IF1G_00764 [Cordyceps javanica]|uniref:Uncharacterized protein n=1 Tax=Cordyceps javanica TaxID=43265 RepID=A0A545WDF0_9HYPO|nr:hypothetical protein IF1G_00764 [Cordyceps javanica]TQW12009.1 hypothetical protein IF2G_00740 [Cordyceps javanica]
MRLFASSVRHRTAPTFYPAIRSHLWRPFHSAKADFTTVDGKGALTTKQIDISIGDPGQSYIIFDKDTGAQMKVAAGQQAGSDPERVSLQFFHESRYFASDATAYPRITIGQDLPRQNDSNMSPATLWLWGATNSITLDGTADRVYDSCPYK